MLPPPQGSPTHPNTMMPPTTNHTILSPTASTLLALIVTIPAWTSKEVYLPANNITSYWQDSAATAAGGWVERSKILTEDTWQGSMFLFRHQVVLLCSTLSFNTFQLLSNFGVSIKLWLLRVFTDGSLLTDFTDRHLYPDFLLIVHKFIGNSSFNPHIYWRFYVTYFINSTVVFMKTRTLLGWWGLEGIISW